MSQPVFPHPAERYETLYGVHLLDDLHNYFPALLYDSSSFQSVQSVLRYIQEQTRARFDLFSYGQREYLSTAPAPVGPSVRRVVRTSMGGSVPGAQVPGASTLLPPSTLQHARPMTIDLSLTQLIQSEEHEGEDGEEDEEGIPPLETALSRALLNLLQIPPAPLVRTYGGLGQGGLDQFLQPVDVRPTPDQIAANTTVGNLVSDTEHSCAICQDTLTAEQEGRKLNACGHWFHKDCIDTWLTRNVRCPVCRHDLREPAVPVD